MNRIETDKAHFVSKLHSAKLDWVSLNYSKNVREQGPISANHLLCLRINGMNNSTLWISILTMKKVFSLLRKPS